MTTDLQIGWDGPDPAFPHGLSLMVQFGPEAELPSLFSLPRLVECFVRFGAAGGYAGARYRPELSRLSLRSADVGEAFAHWRFDEADCAPQTLAVLARLLRYSHRNARPLKRAVVTSRLRLSDGEPSALRGCAPQWAFDLTLERDLKDVLLSVQLAEPPATAAAAELVSLLIGWQFLASAGAFETDERPLAEPLLVVDRRPRWVLGTVSAHLEEAAFDDAAFDALVNALQHYHAGVARIECVEVL